MDELLFQHAKELREIAEQLERFQRKHQDSLSVTADAALTVIRNDVIDRQRKAEVAYADF